MKYKIGNLLDAHKDGIEVIAHQCNCFCTMKAGIAPQIAKKYPEARAADDRTIPGDFDKMGTVTKAVSLKDGTIIYNLYGQYDYKRGLATSYSHLKKALLYMSNELPWGTRIGLPLLGCGLAGGDWKIVSALIQETLGPKHVVTVYVLDKNTLNKVSKYEKDVV